MTPKAVAFDLDGTLAASKAPLTAEMGALVAKLVARMPVAVMSGGSYAQFEKQFLAGLPPGVNLSGLYLFPTSAAQCLEWREGSWQHVYDNEFTSEERERVLRALAESLAETGFDKPPAKLWGPQTEDRGSEISWSALGQQAPIEEKGKWDPDRAKRAPLAAALERRLPDFSIRVNATTTIDITRQGITKAYGLRQWAQIIGIPISEMLYVGDALFPGGNDEVVKETGIPTRQVADPEETRAYIETLTK
jgi:HAD superfamily hydrolase (TIGR01484 family)